MDNNDYKFRSITFNELAEIELALLHDIIANGEINAEAKDKILLGVGMYANSIREAGIRINREMEEWKKNRINEAMNSKKSGGDES